MGAVIEIKMFVHGHSGFKYNPTSFHEVQLVRERTIGSASTAPNLLLNEIVPPRLLVISLWFCKALGNSQGIQSLIHIPSVRL